MIHAFFYYSGVIVWLIVALIAVLLAATTLINAFVTWREKP